MYWLKYWHSCAEYFAHNYHMHTSPEWDSNLGPNSCPYLNFRNWCLRLLVTMASFPYYLLCDKLCVFYFWITDLICNHSYFFNVNYFFNDMNGLLEQNLLDKHALNSPIKYVNIRPMKVKFSKQLWPLWRLLFGWLFRTNFNNLIYFSSSPNF